MSVLSRPHFHDEEAAFTFLEAALWPQGPVCNSCGAMDRISKIKANPEKRIRHGLHKCGHCKKQFRCTVGTVFEHARSSAASARSWKSMRLTSGSRTTSRTGRRATVPRTPSWRLSSVAALRDRSTWTVIAPRNSLRSFAPTSTSTRCS